MSNGAVTELQQGNFAEASDLQPGEVVLESNRQYVKNFSTLQHLADPLKRIDLALLLNHQGNVMYIPIQGE